MGEHGEIEELLALESLGGIEPEDRARLAALRAEHGDCAACAELEAGFRDTAAALGASLSDAEVSAELESRTVAAALAEPRATAQVQSRGRPKAWLAVAAALVLIAIGAVGGYLAAPRSSVAAFHTAAPA